MAAPVSPFDKNDNETDVEYQARLKRAAADTTAKLKNAESNLETVKTDRDKAVSGLATAEFSATKWRGATALVVIVAVLLLGFLWFARGGDDKVIAQKDGVIAGQAKEIAELKNRPLTEGLTSAQCTAMGGGVVDGLKGEIAELKKTCQPKTVAGPIRYRDRPVTVTKAPPISVPTTSVAPRAPVVAEFRQECAWIHPPVAFDQGPTPNAGKRFDKPAGYDGNCVQFVNEIAAKHGFPNYRKIQ